jgi:hypothetical protein
VNYRTLLNGTEHIQSFLEVEYLSPQEALSVANFSLDILIAYQLEKTSPKENIAKCLVDYARFFRGEELAKELAVLLNKGNEYNPISISSPLRFLDLNQYEIEELFKKTILSGVSIPKDMKNELITMLVIALNKCQFELAVFGLYLISKLPIEPSFFSKNEMKALLQAKEYISIYSGTIGSEKIMWWNKFSRILDINNDGT